MTASEGERYNSDAKVTKKNEYLCTPKRDIMLRENTVFGPIHSRRLGNSLGINLLPERGKLCNFDCIYCECGWNRDGRDDTTLPTAAKVRSDLERLLTQCRDRQTPVDSITFSGDGEPTLHPDFGVVIGDTLALRDRYFPQAQVSVLSNATQVYRREVLEALRRVDNPIMKLDAPTNEMAVRINRPGPGYDVHQVVESLRRFEGDFILQTCLLRSADFDSTQPDVIDGWMAIVRTLRPRRVMLYTIDRPTPQQGLQKVGVDEMRQLVQPLLDEGVCIDFYG